MAGLTELRNWLLRLIALSCEGAALWYALADAWPEALGMHVACALALAAEGGTRRLALAFSTALWALCVPVLGPFGLCFVLLPALATRRAQAVDGVIELELGEPGPLPKTELPQVPVADILQSAAADPSRVAAVLWLRGADAKSAVPLLRAALLDRHEDVRLVAFAMLERREKQLRANIDKSLSKLDHTTGLPARAAMYELLCAQHWELVQSGFVSGPAERVTLDTALQYGEEALAARVSGSLALLLARICLRAGDTSSALTHLNTAFTSGVARAVVSPLYAEAAFIKQDFRSVEALLQINQHAALARPAHATLIDFWSGRARP